MPKVKRSKRMSAMLLQLSQQPNRLFSLSSFSKQFECAKSSISEDLSEMGEILQQFGMGQIETIAGAAGGVRFLPFFESKQDFEFIQQICTKLQDTRRIVPGDFLYTVDLFSDPQIVQRLGCILAKRFYSLQCDAVLTIESKGIPIGMMVAWALGKPLVIAHKENRATEGSVVTLNYVTDRSSRLHSMSLARRAMPQGQKVLVIDDFVKGGGTVGCLCEMMKEFSCEVVGIGALISAKKQTNVTSCAVEALLVLNQVQSQTQVIDIYVAPWLQE